MKRIDAPADPSTIDERLVRYGRALQEEHDLMALLTRVVFQARAFTNAEAGTLFLIDGDVLRFTVVQNDYLKRRVGDQHMRQALQTAPLPMTNRSLAGYVALSGKTLNVPDVYELPASCPFSFNRALDARSDYRTRSVLALPIADHHQHVLGVLELINALDAKGRVIPFKVDYTPGLRWFATEAARAIPKLVSQLTTMTLPTAPGVDMAAKAQADGAGIASDPESPAEQDGAVGRRLGDLLLKEGAISLAQLGEALAEQQRTQQRLGGILVRFNYISEAKLMDVLSRQYKLPVISVAGREVSADVLSVVPAVLAKRGGLLPIERSTGTISVAIADPTDLSPLDDLAIATGLKVAAVLAPPSELYDRIAQLYEESTSEAASVLSEVEEETEAPVVRLVNAILSDAVGRGAADVHFESFATSFRIRFRVDGVLVHATTPDKRLEAAVVSHIKVMADLDPDEHRRPQEGRARVRLFDREIDLRVSIIPTMFGESVDIRLLDGATIQSDPARLGLEGGGYEQLMSAIHESNGVILVAGPSGSGKTTTLYSLVHRLNDGQRRILTVEDPVEYVIDGVSQVHVSEETGQTYAGALRTFLRHDPDVILVGEMGDQETAQLAIRAGLTGHLLLSAVHTNDCATTIGRLLGMGVPPALLSSSLRLIVAQRLVRTLCRACRVAYVVEAGQLAPYGFTGDGRPHVQLHKPAGCPRCHDTGFRGQAAIFEVLPIGPALRTAIASSAPIEEIRAIARGDGMTTLRQAALARLVAGDTSLEEVVRSTTLE